MSVFGTRTVTKGRGKRQKTEQQGIAWQAWNADAGQEAAHARLPGSGSFYWPDARAAYRQTVVMMRRDESIHAIRIETISGREVAYVRRTDIAPSFGSHPGQPALIARF